jgi:hypothetical protein
MYSVSLWRPRSRSSVFTDWRLRQGVFAAQLPMYGDDEQCRDHFSSVVLIEAVVSDVDERFTLSDFTQSNPVYPHGAAQVPWDLLLRDGEVVLARSINCVKGTAPLRFAPTCTTGTRNCRCAGRVVKYPVQPLSPCRCGSNYSRHTGPAIDGPYVPISGREVPASGR